MAIQQHAYRQLGRGERQEVNRRKQAQRIGANPQVADDVACCHTVYIAEQVRKEIPSKLLMIGDGPDRQHVEELARTLGIYDDIRVTKSSKNFLEDIHEGFSSRLEFAILTLGVNLD